MLTHWNISVASLRVIRSRTWSQWSWRKSGVTCSRQLALNIRRAPAFTTACSWLSRLAVRCYNSPIWTGPGWPSF